MAPNLHFEHRRRTRFWPLDKGNVFTLCRVKRLHRGQYFPRPFPTFLTGCLEDQPMQWQLLHSKYEPLLRKVPFPQPGQFRPRPGLLAISVSLVCLAEKRPTVYWRRLAKKWGHAPVHQKPGRSRTEIFLSGSHRLRLNDSARA